MDIFGDTEGLGILGRPVTSSSDAPPQPRQGNKWRGLRAEVKKQKRLVGKILERRTCRAIS